MTTTRGETPLTKTARNGHQVPPPRPPAKAEPKAKAQAEEPARKSSSLDILGVR